jgi:hypothetical protein
MQRRSEFHAVEQVCGAGRLARIGAWRATRSAAELAAVVQPVHEAFHARAIADHRRRFAASGMTDTEAVRMLFCHTVDLLPGQECRA